VQRILLLLFLHTTNPPFTAVLAELVEPDGLPDVPHAARVLDQGGRVAEGGEGEGRVLACVEVGVVAAHISFFLPLFSLSASVRFCLDF
jgi:hypothetical protein